MKQTKWIAIALVLCLLLMLFPTNVFADDGDAEGRVYLEVYTTGYVGQSSWVSWRVEPYEAHSELKELISSDPTVIQIINERRVEYIAPGTATLTLILENGLTDSVTVTVKESPEISPLVLGESFDFALNSREYAIYSFTPPESGDYIYYYTYDSDVYMGTYGIYEADTATYVSCAGSKLIGGYEASSVYLEAGKDYWFKLGNMGGIDKSNSYTGTAGVLKRPKAESIAFTKPSYVVYCTSGLPMMFSLDLVVEPVFSFVFGEYSGLKVTVSDPDIAGYFYEHHEGFHELLLKRPGQVTVTATLDGRSASCEFIILDDKYEMLEGGGLEVSDENLDEVVFRADGDLDKFTGVYVDSQPVDPVNYTATPGSTIITFAPEYLRTLATGNHTLIIAFGDECAHTTFSVTPLSSPEPTPENPTTPNEPETPTTPDDPMPPTTPADPTSPQTGDSSLLVLPVALMVASVFGFGIVLNKKKYI